MKCPRCNTVEMEVQTRGDGDGKVEVDHCSSCKGLWLDAKELADLDDNFFVDVEEIEFKEVAPTDEDSSIGCPRCDGAPALGKVRPVNLGDVVLDRCSVCKGFWLDAGELEKMAEISDRALIASLAE